MPTPVLALCEGLPLLQVPAGHVLIAEGARTDRLYVLRRGEFEIVRGGVRVITTAEPGAFLGEMSVLLQVPATADVVALRPSTVHVWDHAARAVTRNPALTLAIARLLARRLQALTAYLADLKRQYADSDTHLAVMDQVLAGLMAMQSAGVASGGVGSERPDVPND